MVRRAFNLVAASCATFVAACDAAPSSESNLTANAGAAALKPIDGYGELKFGSTLMEALATAGTERFNSYGLKECLDDLPLSGCFLSAASDASPFLIEGGVPYKLGLDFNKFDKLTDIRLSYDREGKITFNDCLSIHERTLDWLTRKFGSLRPTINEKEQVEQRKTPAGNGYLLWRSKDGSFVTTPMRTAPPTLPASVQQKPIPQWDNKRYLHLLSHFIVVDGKPMCHVGSEFSEPQSVERRPPSKDTGSEPTVEPEVADEPELEGGGEPMHGPYGDEESNTLNGDAESSNVEDE